MPTYKTEGFIFKRKPLGETSRLYSVFTRDHGKIEVLAEGSSKITSKLAGDLEPFNFCQLMIAPGRYFERVAGAKIINEPSLAADWTTLTLKWVLSEGLNNLTYNHLAEPKIYDLLKENFNYLKNQDNRLERIFSVIKFFWLVFLIIGHRSKTEIRDNSGENIYFDKFNGNFYPAREKERLGPDEIGQFLPVKPALLDFLKRLDGCYLENDCLLEEPLAKELINNFYCLVVNYYQTLTDKKLNSFQFLIYA